MKYLYLFIIFLLFNISAFGDLLPYEDEWTPGLFGYIDQTGKIIIPAQFRSFGLPDSMPIPFVNGMLRKMHIDSNTTTFFKTDGTEIIYNFSHMGDFSSGITWGKMNNRFYSIKMNGESSPINYIINGIITCYSGNFFNEGIAFIYDENYKVIAIDTSFRKLFELPVSLENTSGRFSSGLLAVRNSRGLWGYLGITGRMAIPARYNLINLPSIGNEYINFQGNYAILSENNSDFYIINKQGNEIKRFSLIFHSDNRKHMFIQGDFLVYKPIVNYYDEYFNIFIYNLITKEEIQLRLKKDNYGFGYPLKLGNNILCYNKIITYDGRILTELSDFHGRVIQIWYEKYIVIHNEGYFTIYDENGKKIPVPY